MFNYLSSILIVPVLIFCNINYKINVDTVNYYGIPTDLTFNDINYQLSWSSHPNDTYYKQEYTAKGDDPGHYNDMVLIEFLISDMQVKDAVQSQILTLLQRKQTDDVCNYQVIKNAKSGEYILDFLMSDKTDDHYIIEWDGYHYKPYTDKAGHKGVLLFGVSHRTYNDDTHRFMLGLKNYRNNILQKISVYEIPEIQVN